MVHQSHLRSKNFINPDAEKVCNAIPELQRRAVLVLLHGYDGVPSNSGKLFQIVPYFIVYINLQNFFI